MSQVDVMIRAQLEPDGIAAILARYAAIVDDSQSLLAVSQAPLPVCCWHNPLKCGEASLLAALADQAITLEPIAWQPGAFRSHHWPGPGNTLPFSAGWYYVQEEIAMTAVAALAPQPGERILDLCAAPGGKTAQIALLNPTGTVIANEMQAARLPSLSVNLNRLGLTQVITTQADGRSLPLPDQSFDRVLVDAPCSGEGNLRRRRRFRPWHPTHGLRMATVQQKLLSRALDLVKPGGTVVYSTCTFAPEENEAVLDAVMGDRAVVVPFKIPGLTAQPGLAQWQGQTYRADIKHAQRYFPHFNNTGGFFVARLQRTSVPPLTKAPGVSHSSVTQPHLPPVPWSIDESPLLQLCERFAIAPSIFDSYDCWATGKHRFWLLDRTSRPPTELGVQTVGLALATQTNLGLKPSTAFLQRFGPLGQKNVVHLPDLGAATQFLRGESQHLLADVEPGYVHVRFRQFELGCGRYRGGWLDSQIPKILRRPTLDS
ncbi:MAG: NOL1/NOP2/sun family putative RNA methylase [Leptolyngbya sp. SIOISBB]|nr:NOL1/NOP2/sun family putative RNA methylase [Leptolyngbya sp. SIOISBB]